MAAQGRENAFVCAGSLEKGSALRFLEIGQRLVRLRDSKPEQLDRGQTVGAHGRENSNDSRADARTPLLPRRQLDTARFVWKGFGFFA